MLDTDDFKYTCKFWRTTSNMKLVYITVSNVVVNAVPTYWCLKLCVHIVAIYATAMVIVFGCTCSHQEFLI